MGLGLGLRLRLGLNHPFTSLIIFVFRFHPLVENSYMALLCFKNGSLVRQSLRDKYSGGSWEKFEQSLRESSSGNHGYIGIYFHETEITPFAQGTYRFNKEDDKVTCFSEDEEIRALIESQFLAKRVHAENLGYHLGELL